MIERSGEQSHLIRLIHVHAMLVITLPDLARPFGELQNWFGHAARNPNSNCCRNRQPKKSKNQVGPLEVEIRCQFSIKRALKKHGSRSGFGPKRKQITKITLTVQADVSNLLWNECTLLQG